jgi:hypothetical protein
MVWASAAIVSANKASLDEEVSSSCFLDCSPRTSMAEVSLTGVAGAMLTIAGVSDGRFPQLWFLLLPALPLQVDVYCFRY